MLFSSLLFNLLAVKLLKEPISSRSLLTSLGDWGKNDPSRTKCEFTYKFCLASNKWEETGVLQIAMYIVDFPFLSFFLFLFANIHTNTNKKPPLK